MKYIVMFVLGLLLCTGLAAQSMPQPPPAKENAPFIVYLGNLPDGNTPKLMYRQCPTADINTGSDTAKQIAHAVRNGLLDDFAPKIIVLLLGAEDAGPTQSTPWSCARNIGDLLHALRTKQPKATIVLLPILPVHSQPMRATIRKTNRLLQTLADGHSVIFADVSQALMPPNSDTPDPTLLSPKQKHPTAEGCQRIADALQSTLERLLK